jgi:hypothetical protein
MDATTHRWRVEIVAEKRSLFRSHRDSAAPDLFLDTMLNRRICEACPIDCTKGLSNMYKNRSQICRPMGKLTEMLS